MTMWDWDYDPEETERVYGECLALSGGRRIHIESTPYTEAEQAVVDKFIEQLHRREEERMCRGARSHGY